MSIKTTLKFNIRDVLMASSRNKMEMMRIDDELTGLSDIEELLYIGDIHPEDVVASFINDPESEEGPEVYIIEEWNGDAVIGANVKTLALYFMAHEIPFHMESVRDKR